LRPDGAACSSPPPCDGGLGAGVEPSGAARASWHDPPPQPSLASWEEAPRSQLAPMRAPSGTGQS
jgi:hypothetical protein